MNKKIIKTMVLSMMMLSLVVAPLSVPIYAATDLPIGEDEFIQVDGMSPRAVTVSRGIELFTEYSREITEAMVAQREARREEALGGLFDPYLQLDKLRGDERLLNHVVTSELFREGVFFREGGPIETVENDYTLVIVMLLISSGIIGFIIAKLSLKRKEKEENVH